VRHDITLIPNQSERSFHVLANMGDLSAVTVGSSGSTDRVGVSLAQIGCKCRWTFSNEWRDRLTVI